MNTLIEILFIPVAFFFMEFVAWFTHKYIMHGFLWVLHKDHHTREHHPFELNDLFVLIFASPSVIMIIKGIPNFDYRFFIGVGIALYGLMYFLFHDVLVHRRLKILDRIDNWYFRGIVRAHNHHHEGRKNYGFLLMIPWKYFGEETEAKRGKY